MANSSHPAPTLLPARRPLCGLCGLPLRSCCCRDIRPTANEVPVLILQHPQEVAQAKGSVRLLRLSLARQRCEVGAQFDPAWLAAWLRGAAHPDGPGDGRTPCLLYPAAATADDAAAAGGPEAAAKCSLPPIGSPMMPMTRLRLVLLDATWRHSRQMLRAHPQLQALPRWSLQSPPPSLYAVRTAAAEHQRSSLEACCLALAQLEGRPERYVPLLSSFETWADRLAQQFKRSGSAAASAG